MQNNTSQGTCAVHTYTHVRQPCDASSAVRLLLLCEAAQARLHVTISALDSRSPGGCHTSRLLGVRAPLRAKE